MKIVLLGTAKPTIGGISTHIENLAARLIREGNSVRIIDFNNSSKTESEYSVYRVGKNVFKLYYTLLKLIFNEYSIFHYHTSKKAIPFILSAWLLKLFNRHIIISIHSGEFINWFLKNNNYARVLKKTLLQAEGIFFMNKSQSELFSHLFTTYQGNLSFYASYINPLKKVNFQNKIDISNGIKILCVGLWQEYYRYEVALKSCLEWSKAIDQKIYFTIVSGTIAKNNTYKKEIEELVKNSNTDKFSCTIKEDVWDMTPLLIDSHILIRSSVIDSYGLIIAEALAVGTIAIATNVCKRPLQTILYNPQHPSELIQKLKSIENILNTQRKRRSMIHEWEDGFNKIYSYYRNLVKR